ncbi:hypothetical protein D5F01_LYC23874 [Larimichthys crocea]|uniref:Uncharacterized protein n=1 Tax=Larimichthys crocea TaxID=215358 RepID=A0A6G0HFV5_LARCR|nr:hypothetical protein D5F01_LYC23874 [Larimichthys crocea]
MGASKQLSNYLKTKIVQHHGLREGYKKLAQRFKLSVSTVRNIVRKWKTTGTVLVKARSGRPRKISEKQRRRMGPQNNTANIATEKANDNAKEGEGEANDSVPSNSVILDAIRSLKEDFTKQSNEMLDAINGIKADVVSHSRRIGETEERISQAEEDLTTLQQKVGQLEGTVEILRNKIQEQEDRGRRSNLRLIGLPEKTEGPDMCSFLENWLPKALSDDLASTPVIERAHRVGQVNSSRSSAPRPIVMTFLNNKDCKKTLRAARKQKEVRYGNQRVSFFPDLSAETRQRQRQRQFSGGKARFQAMDIRYGLLYPAHLVVTHNVERLVFKSVKEAKDFLREMQTSPRATPRPET